MKGIPLRMQFEGFPDAKQQEGAVIIVRGFLRCSIEQLATEEGGHEETLCVEADIDIALFDVFRGGPSFLLGCKMLQTAGIGAAYLGVGIALLHDANDISVKGKYHHSLERREYLILHICHACLLTGEAEAIEGKHVALIEVLKRDDGGGAFDDNLYTLEAVVHEVGFPQSLPQAVACVCLSGDGEVVGLHDRAIVGGDYRKRKSIRTRADG